MSDPIVRGKAKLAWIPSEAGEPEILTPTTAISSEGSTEFVDLSEFLEVQESEEER